MKRLLCCLPCEDSPGVTSQRQTELTALPPHLVVQDPTPVPVPSSVAVTTWQDLPQELLTKITSKLDNVDLIALRLVSQAWCRVASEHLTALDQCYDCDSTAKSHARARAHDGKEDKDFILACAAFPNLHKVDTSRQLTSQGLLAGLALLPKLDTLCLNHDPIVKHRDLVCRAKSCKFATGRHASRLETNSLARLTALDGQLRSEGADASVKLASAASMYLDIRSLQPLTNLQKLTISGMEDAHSRSTLDLAKLTSLKQLESLEVSYFDNIVCRGDAPFGLKTLHIYYSGLAEVEWLSACGSLWKGCLKELSLISISECLPPFLLQYCSSLIQLTALDIGKCAFLDYTKYPAEIPEFHLDSYHTVLRGMTNLAKLDLDWGWRLGNRSLDTLAGLGNLTCLAVGNQAQWSNFQDLGKLMRLKSYGMCCGDSGSVGMEESALKAALSRLPDLTTLFLMGNCSGLIRGISHQISGLSQLALDYRCIKDIGEVASLTALANMTQLRSLFIVLCCHEDCAQSFADNLLEAVSEAASVQYLHIFGNGATTIPAPLTGEGLRHLTRMPRLKKVQLLYWSGGFTNLRHEDLKAVMRGLPDLLLLRLSGDHSISARMVAALHRSFPRVNLSLGSLTFRFSDMGWET